MAMSKNTASDNNAFPKPGHNSLPPWPGNPVLTKGHQSADVVCVALVAEGAGQLAQGAQRFHTFSGPTGLLRHHFIIIFEFLSWPLLAFSDILCSCSGSSQNKERKKQKIYI